MAAGYIRKLTREQIVEACAMMESGTYHVPQVAYKYDLTIGQALTMFGKELVDKTKIKFKKYGKERYSWNDPKTKEQLKRLIDAGNDDDQIAALWQTSYYAVSRGRSTAGLVSCNRPRKGHHTPHSFSHLDKGGLESSAQSKLEFEIHNDHHGGHMVAQRRATTPTKTRAQIEDEAIVLCIQHDVDGRGSSTPQDVYQALIKNITWRSIALRMQSGNHLYKVVTGDKTFYYRQVNIDVANNLVDLVLVKTITTIIKVDKSANQ